MGFKKLERFAEVATFPNVLQLPKNMPGQWAGFFKNNHPITLELACGKGEYTVGLGRLHPHRNFIGVDLKGVRIWKGAKIALTENMQNVGFLRTAIDQITDYFAPGEITEIWLPFPDPQLRTSKAKKRLTHPKFLRKYQQIMVPNGIIHLKTDSPSLYRFTKWVIELYDLPLLQDIENIYELEQLSDELSIKTHYQSLDIAQSNRVHYLQFQLPATPLPEEKDALLKERLSEEVIDRRS